ncbi:MAG: hypothetical protein R3B48_19280 [Kofleriaceae bacterium]
MSARRLHAALFVLGLVVYGGLAGARLWRPSPAPHFVLQADAWLHGRAAIAPPLVGDDWAKVEVVEVRPAAPGEPPRQARGRRLHTRPVFLTTSGEELPLERVGARVSVTAYVSFPPAPTLLMLPSALLAGRAGNDVVPTVLLAALILPLAFAMLRRLAAAGLSERTPREDLWWVVTLAFGSVLFFSAVGGKVWYTAHVAGVALALGYLWAAIEARRPALAGLLLGLAALTRTPMAFLFPVFLWELGRTLGGRARFANPAERRAMLREAARPLLRFAVPVLALAVAAALYNLARFGAATEFGHSYLDVRQQQQIETWGLFNLRYLARNLAVAFTLLPELPGRPPWVQIGGHGLALWVTTPILLTLLWPRRSSPIAGGLWLAVAAVALPTLLYQNSGWVQFGYRFSLDYLPLLIALLAIGGRPLHRTAKALIVVGVVVNLFGAITFDRLPQFYRWNGNAYDVVVGH